MLKGYKLNIGMLSYLRSNLEKNFERQNPQKLNLMMVGSPRVIEFEQLMMDFAIKLV
jgi:hypothetical protein